MSTNPHLHNKPTTKHSINPDSGFCPETQIFHSLQPSPPLPSPTSPPSITSYALSILHHNPPPPNTVLLTDAITGEEITYEDFTHFIKSLSYSLHHTLHLQKGDTALILSPNSTKLPILFFSLLSLGIIVSPANPAGTEAEIARQISLSNASILFSTTENASKVRNGIGIRIIVIDSPEFDSLITQQLYTSATIPYAVSPLQNDVAAVLYSSGTTGKMKGVELTHRNLTAILASYNQSPVQEPGAAVVVVLYTVPLFHVYGFNHIIKSVGFRERVVLMEKWGGVRSMMKAVEQFNVTRITLAPPVVVAMTKGEVGEYDIGSLKVVGCAGAPLGKDVIAAFSARFPGVCLTQGYGLTETSGAVFRALRPNKPIKPGSTGRLVGSFEAKIVDVTTGKALPPCTYGELWIRGPAIMKGYVGGGGDKEEATLVSGGWFRTGDLCYIDEQGYMFVVDRLKEMIKYKGYQVAPAELEQLLNSHPDISDAAVVPLSDDEAGEIPIAFVVRHANRNSSSSILDEAQVMDFVAKQVAPYKKIRRVAFVDSIPKNATGKIMRRELKNMAFFSSRL